MIKLPMALRLLSFSLLSLPICSAIDTIAGVPPDFPPRLDVGLTAPVGPTTDIELLAGPSTVPIDQTRYSRIIYVSATQGSDSIGIGSATSPYSTFQGALSRIDDSSDLDLHALFVSAGFYMTTAPISVPQQTHVYGGFDPVTWVRNIETQETVVDGGKMVSSVLVAANDTRFDGLVIQNGGRKVSTTTDLGGGIHVVRNASATISNNVFRNNEADDGGGVFADNESLSTIQHNLFYGNSSPFGSAIYVGIRATSEISGNIVRDSTGDGRASVYATFDNTLSIHRNIVKSNAGGGIHCDCRSGTVSDNVIVGNHGDGLVFECRMPSVVASNMISRNTGIGIAYPEGSTTTISHNIVADNQGNGISGHSGVVFDNLVTGNLGVGIRGWQGVARNNVVVRNDSRFDGGGILWTDGTIDKNLVASNHTVERGGGIHSRFVAGVTITTNLVAANTSDWEGGGIYCNEGILLNNIIHRNEAPIGAGVICQKDTLLAANNLVLENAAQTQAGGVFFRYNSEPTAINNLIYGNTANGFPNQIVRESQILSMRNCLVQGGFEGDDIIDSDPQLVGQLLAGGVASVTYNSEIAQTTILVSDPPLISGSLNGRYIEIGSKGTAVVENSTDEIRVWGDFVDDVSGVSDPSWRIPDFRLREDSPCIGAGLGPDAFSGVPLEDVDGDLRSGQASDIGVDEFNGNYSLPTPLPTSTPTPTLTPSKTPTSSSTFTPSATLTPTEQAISQYDLYPVGGDGMIDTRDLIEFLAERRDNPNSILGYALIWKQ